MLIFAFENCIENCNNDLFSLVLDTFCICKSMAFQIQDTRNDESGKPKIEKIKTATITTF